MSKYRKGAVYLRHLKPTDKSTSFQVSIRLAYFNDKNIWKHPERVTPVVLVQHGCKGVMEVFMTREDALRQLMMYRERRARNTKHNAKRGQRQTKGDLSKAFRRWAFKHRSGGAK
ncbi:hypothetical protein [Atlantibacter hermannii]|uniref:hypothetical protein n=1 Tax=Atlantibacter hermannii TaxID=565 RepID=UPI002899D76D|nr:hypothetical protein [Atlantibacter hermannii]